MCIGSSHRHENFKNTKATLSIYDILDKGERRGGVLAFKSENGQFIGI